MTSLLPSVPELYQVALVAFVRATILLAGALAISQLFQRSSATARHAFWTVTAVALLVLPWTPGWLQVLPMPATVTNTKTLHKATTGGAVAIADQNAARSTSATNPADAKGIAGRVGGSTMTASEEPGAIELAKLQAAQNLGDHEQQRLLQKMKAAALETDGLRPAFTVTPRAETVLLALWALGLTMALASLILGIVRVRAIARGASPLGPEWRSALEGARASAAVRREVAVGSTASTQIPMTGGVVRPFVLVPASAESWTAERRSLVLLHELVHVARHDALRQLLSRAASAIYWFHPLAHVAAKRALLAREEACDEAVIALGWRPSVYARHLLELSEAAATPLPVLGLVDRTQLERRMMSILKPGPRSGRAATLAACAGALVWAATVAAVAPKTETHTPTTPRSSSVLRSNADASLPGRPTGLLSQPSGRFMLGSAARATTMVPPVAEFRSVSPLTQVVASKPTTASAEQVVSCWSDAASGAASDPAWTLRGSREGMTWFSADAANPGDFALQTRVRGTDVCIRTHGAVQFSGDKSRIESIAEGGWVILGSRDDRTIELRITPQASGFSYAWTVNGAARAFGSEGQEWRDALLPIVGEYVSLVNGQAAAAAAGADRAAAEAERAARLSATAAELASKRDWVALGTPDLAEAKLRLDAARRELETKLELAERSGASAAELARLKEAYAVQAQAIERLGTPNGTVWFSRPGGDTIVMGTVRLDRAGSVEELRAVEATLLSKRAEVAQALEAARASGADVRTRQAELAKEVEQLTAVAGDLQKRAELRQLEVVAGRADAIAERVRYTTELAAAKEAGAVARVRSRDLESSAALQERIAPQIDRLMEAIQRIP